MVKKNCFIFALGTAVALAGCTDDVVTDFNNDNAVSFATTVGKTIRVADNTSSTMQSDADGFRVWGFTQESATLPEELYIPSLQVRFADGEWSYTGRHFWPQSNLNFYAVYPFAPKGQQGEFTMSDGTHSMEYKALDGSEDLLYSTLKGQTKPAYGAKTLLNFRHAMAQVVFKVKETGTSTINVDIKAIKIDGIQHSGTFNWPNESTAIDGTALGSWTLSADKAKQEYSVVDKLETPYRVTRSADFVNQDASTANKEFANNLFTIPQPLDVWNTVPGTPYDNGARVLVYCRITSKTGNKLLWPEAGVTQDGGYAWAALPLSGNGKALEWKQGKKYTYTLIFGEGAGYDPESNDPVLVPIHFEVSVDNFTSYPQNIDGQTS